MSVFITGGGGGLGRAIAKGFAERGKDVALVDMALAPAEEAAAALAGEFGISAVGVQCDITKRESVDAAWAAAQTAVGPIDVVVNCAGIFVPTAFLDMPIENWDRTLAINLTGAFNVSQLAAQTWVAAGVQGAMVNVASTAAFSAGEGLGASDYGASKAGLIGLTIHLAVDLGPYGIRTNAIAPGSFYSPMNAERLKDPEQEKKSADFSPMKRIAQPEEVAAAVVFLALDGTYVNGQVVAVDGGIQVRM